LEALEKKRLLPYENKNLSLTKRGKKVLQDTQSLRSLSVDSAIGSGKKSVKVQ